MFFLLISVFWTKVKPSSNTIQRNWQQRWWQQQQQQSQPVEPTKQQNHAILIAKKNTRMPKNRLMRFSKDIQGNRRVLKRVSDEYNYRPNHFHLLWPDLPASWDQQSRISYISGYLNVPRRLLDMIKKVWTSLIMRLQSKCKILLDFFQNADRKWWDFGIFFEFSTLDNTNKTDEYGQ